MELLGNKVCVESLQKDLGDIHKILGNLTSRLGPVNFKSWKYPDKLASELDISELIEMCEYDGNFPEENKISHMMLLELTLDRLLFFIQCSYRFLDSMNARAPSAVDNCSSSIGVVAKKYWSRVIQLQSNMQQLVSDNKSNLKKIKELQAFNQELQDELSKYHDGVTNITSSSAMGRREIANGSAIPPTTPHKCDTIAKDNSNKASQTVETAFLPCEYCYLVQASLKSVADSMTDLCKSQGLPCATAKYRQQLKGLDWYSATDLQRWKTEQNKDLDRINKHLSDLMSTIDPLKEELSSSINSCRALEERVAECKRQIQAEKDSHTAQQKQHSTQMEALTRQHGQVKTELENDLESMKQTRQKLDERLQETRCTLELERSKYKELDDIKQQLMIELEESKTNNSEVKRLTSILNSLEAELGATKENLQTTETRLSEERALVKSLTKRTESLQSKYDSLVRRLGEMDEENGSLQLELSALVEEKERLEDSLKGALTSSNAHSQSTVEKIEAEKRSLKTTIAQLEGTVAGMEADLTELREKQRLIVEYPDLNGPVNADLTGTGDLVTDMSNQLKANVVRIELLTNQNTSLVKTLSKLKGRPAGAPSAAKEPPRPPAYPSTEPSAPTRLWSQALPAGNRLEEVDTYKAERGDHYGHENDSSKTSKQHKPSTGYGEFTVGKNPQSDARARGDNSSMDAYVKLKKAGLLKTQSPSNKKTNAPAAEAAAGQQTFTCPNCDKLYHSAADLHLHRSYCARR